jgi:VanZ family protein
MDLFHVGVRVPRATIDWARSFGSAVGMTTRKILRVSAWLMLFGITAFSIIPPDYRVVTDVPHAVEHFAAFLCSSGWPFALGYPSLYMARSVVLLLFAAAIELAQLWVPGRHARFSDFLVNSLGLSIGIALAYVVTRPRDQQKAADHRGLRGRRGKSWLLVDASALFFHESRGICLAYVTRKRMPKWLRRSMLGTRHCAIGSSTPAGILDASHIGQINSSCVGA